MKAIEYHASFSEPGGNAAWLWQRLNEEARLLMQQEGHLACELRQRVLEQASLGAAVAALLADKLATETLDAASLRSQFLQSMSDDDGIAFAMMEDIIAIHRRDPACESYLTPLLFYKGFHAISAYRLAHWLWRQERRALARWLQSRVSECLGVDIHPAARIGHGILLDHAHGCVIGETAVVDDDVSILHNVTLGGTGKHMGDRHPKVRSGVLLGAGAQILGNIEIGRGAKVGAGSVVMHDVPAHVTAAGVLARCVGIPESAQPAEAMNQHVEPITRASTLRSETWPRHEGTNPPTSAGRALSNPSGISPDE